MSDTLVIFGDWRDTRAALEQAIPGYSDLDEAVRKKLWDTVTAFAKHYAPLRAKCIECGTIMPARSAYRCADCHGHLCGQCIRPHFEGRPSPYRNSPSARSEP